MGRNQETVEAGQGKGRFNSVTAAEISVRYKLKVWGPSGTRVVIAQPSKST